MVEKCAFVSSDRFNRNEGNTWYQRDGNKIDNGDDSTPIVQFFKFFDRSFKNSTVTSIKNMRTII